MVVIGDDAGVKDGDSADLVGKIISKVELYDVVTEFAPFEKVEGLAFMSNKRLVISHDNDGGLTTTKVLIKKGVTGLIQGLFP